MEKKIEVCIGSDRTSNVRARLSLLVVDGDQVLSEQYHSVNISPLDNPAVLRASLEAHLTAPFEQSGIPGAPWPAIPNAEWDKVTGVVGVFHTPAVVQKAQASADALESARVQELEAK